MSNYYNKINMKNIKILNSIKIWEFTFEKIVYEYAEKCDCEWYNKCNCDKSYYTAIRYRILEKNIYAINKKELLFLLKDKVIKEKEHRLISMWYTVSDILNWKFEREINKEKYLFEKRKIK